MINRNESKRELCWRELAKPFACVGVRFANNFSSTVGVVRVRGEVSVIYKVSRGDGPLLTFRINSLSVSLQRNNSTKNENSLSLPYQKVTFKEHPVHSFPYECN